MVTLASLPRNYCFCLIKMENDLRIDSFDYRTELLSPAPPGENVTLTVEPSWRLNMDRFHLPERRMDSHLSIGYYIKTLSKFSLTYTYTLSSFSYFAGYIQTIYSWVFAALICFKN